METKCYHHRANIASVSIQSMTIDTKVLCQGSRVSYLSVRFKPKCLQCAGFEFEAAFMSCVSMVRASKSLASPREGVVSE